MVAALPGWLQVSAAERVFRAANGRQVRFRDDSSEGEGNARYRLLGRLPGTSYAVVSRSGWEYLDYVLVSEAGDTLAVEGWPVVAPDGQRFAAASVDFVPCYQSNSLEVWRLGTAMPVREFQRETGNCAEMQGWGPSEIVWRDGKTVEFTVNRPGKDGGDPRPSGRGRLTRGATGWTLTVPPP